MVREWDNLQCNDFIYLFMIYSDHTVSSGRVVSEYCFGKDVKVAIVSRFDKLPRNFSGWNKENDEKHQDSRYSDRNSYQAPPKYKQEPLPLEPTCLAKGII